MRWLADDAPALPEWSGELYLELHRGTLTSIAGIKRGNRKAEFALREAEFACTLASLRGAPYPREGIGALWEELLVNQFHDILPGSSIAQVNDEAIGSFARIMREADQLTVDALASATDGAQTGRRAVLLANSLSWDRERSVVIGEPPDGLRPVGEGIVWQRFEGLDGAPRLALSGLSVPALGTTVVELARRDDPTPRSPFRTSARTITTPHAKVRFDHEGRIVSLEDRASGRRVGCGPRFLNDFFLGEDIPAAWDNWDIDADQELKMSRDGRLLSREVVSIGPLQLRVRSRFALGENSEILQDMVFHADSPQVDFETVVDWHEKRKLLKVYFTLNVLADSARHEIQFGHVERPTHRNLPQDRARFEVCAHKWTDMSDNGFGVALLNDCKYGVSVKGDRIGLSLIKSGTHPDPRGDEGRHTFTYSILPHNGPFSTESVIRPAYELNIPVTYAGCDAGTQCMNSLVAVDALNVIVEAVKWADRGNAFVLRLYDAGRMGRHVTVTFGVPVREVARTDLLEGIVTKLPLASGQVSLYVRPFQIVTLRCEV
jgi:alpha-mannosidase